MRVPVFTEPSDEEKKIAELQLGIAARLRTSQYYIVEKTKSTGKNMLVQRFQIMNVYFQNYHVILISIGPQAAPSRL